MNPCYITTRKRWDNQNIIKKRRGLKVTKFIKQDIKRAIRGALVGTAMVPVLGICAYDFAKVWNGGNSYIRQSLKKRFEVAYNPKIDRYAKENMLYYSAGDSYSHNGSYIPYPGPREIYSLHALLLVAGAFTGFITPTAEEERKRRFFDRQSQKTY